MVKKQGTSMTVQGLTIGKVARKSGVNVETVRYYQRMGLIDEPVKPPQGYRNYSEEHITKIRFIKRAQLLGFSLKEIQELMKLHLSPIAENKNVIDEKLAAIDLRIQDLQSIKHALTEFKQESTVKSYESIMEILV